MKILWITNVPTPEASLLLNEPASAFGGWLTNTSRYLSVQEDFELFIAFPKSNLKDNQTLYGNRITYYTFPKVKNNLGRSIDSNTYLKAIIDEINPDIVHIFGTEFEHSLAMINVCVNQGIETVISIQGIVSVIAKHFMADLPINIQRRFTLRDFIKQDNIQQQQEKFIEKGLLEIEAIKRTKHVIGRTTWDKACVTQINSDVLYYFCNETLREEFYNQEWKIDQCEKFSIFVSQASYSIKGIHYVLEAMPLILKRFPHAKLYISGQDITKLETIKQKIKLSSYGKYIRELMKKYELEGNVIFTGILNEKEMCERYMKSNVFVCPSSIENSPNSLGEAMIIGVPSVASFVGGIPDLLKDKEEGFLYQHDAPYMLANYVCNIFQDEDLALKFSKNAREHALKTHDRDENTRRLIEIYNEILGQ